MATTLNDAVQMVEACLGRMDQLYGGTIFDEWALMIIAPQESRILHYSGPRRDDWQRTLADSLREVAAELPVRLPNVGDFEFLPKGNGTYLDTCLAVGEACYLICNNTAASMAGISEDPRWLEAQVPFVELRDDFRADPLVQPTS
jgi:hypothetical protein